jgi:hypothetical protein
MPDAMFGRLTVAAAAALALALAGCGGSARPSTASAPTGAGRPAAAATSLPAGGATGPSSAPAATAGSGRSNAAGAPPTGAATGGAATGGKPSAGGTRPAGSTSSAPLPVTVAVTPCVSVGGTQTLHVQSAPGVIVVYDNSYADRSEGRTHGGSAADGHTDAHGTYVASWIVQPRTPTGAVRLDVAVAGQGRTGTTQKTWTIAAHC